MRAFDSGLDGGVPYLAMERIDSTTLARLLADNRPLPPTRAARIGSQIADAVNAAHDAGLLHRDIKPANVMVRADDSDVVIDSASPDQPPGRR